MTSADRPCRDSRRHGAVSRRACLSALATVAVVPALPARAQIDWHKVDIWQVYRREDLGFEVEMPGVPEIEEEKDADATSINAEVQFEGMTFAVTHHTFTYAITIEDVPALQHEALQNLNIEARITRKSEITINGFPGFEFVAESKTRPLCLCPAYLRHEGSRALHRRV